MFRYVFGGSIHVPGVDYVDCLIPGRRDPSVWAAGLSGFLLAAMRGGVSFATLVV